MRIEDVNQYLGKLVHYQDDLRLLNCDFRFNACIKRATTRGVKYEAELQSLIQEKSVIIVPLEEVQVKV
jgi:hypothetical protein